LRAGEVSGPVLTPFGYHLIKVDERKGDTIAVRHILLRITQSDSAATATDRQADELARIASGADDRSQLDSAAKQLGLTIQPSRAMENFPAMVGNMTVPSASAWAFGGARSGEISELFDDDNGYWVARLDSIHHGGEPSFERFAQEARAAVAREKTLDQLMPRAGSSWSPDRRHRTRRRPSPRARAVVFRQRRSRLGSEALSSSRLAGSPVLSWSARASRSGSRIWRSTSLMLRLNSRMPRPMDAPISGTRFAPKITRTITRIISSSSGPMFPKFIRAPRRANER
jgi:hypothetical protein